MIELITVLIVLFVALSIKIHRATKRFAARERGYIEERRMFCSTKVCCLYDCDKFILTIIVIPATIYLSVCRAAGEVIGLRHMTNAKFWEIVEGCAAILLPQFFLCRFLRISIKFCRRYLPQFRIIPFFYPSQRKHL